MIDDVEDELAIPLPSAQFAQRFADSGVLLSNYQRLLAEQLRYFALKGMSACSDVRLQLADLYVERLLTPLDFATPVGEPMAQARVDSTLSDLVNQSGARIWLEGARGSGKTTCLSMLTLACVDPAISADVLVNWSNPAPLPLLLRANELATALLLADITPDASQAVWLAACWDAIETQLATHELGPLLLMIQQLLERGGCLVLIDSVEDLPVGTTTQAFLATLDHFIARYPDNRYVITCGILPARLITPLASFKRFGLPALDASAIDALVARWYAAIAESVGWRTSEEVARRVGVLRSLLHGDAQLQRLAQLPLILVLCILAHAENYELPAQWRIVFQRLAELLLIGWDHYRPSLQAVAAIATPELCLQLFAPVALAFQVRAAATNETVALLDANELRLLLRSALPAEEMEAGVDGEQVIEQLLAYSCQNGLLSQTAAGDYAMPQPLVREYLAGQALACLPDFSSYVYPLRKDLHWHAPLLHALQELARRAEPQPVRILLEQLLYASVGDSLGQDLCLAAECLLELGAQLDANRMLRADIQARLIAFMRTSSAPIAARVQAGLLLGRLGDPRFAALLPPLIEIAAGTFILGTPDGYEDEGPEQQMHLPAFQIGRYPVTNQEFARFLAAHPQRPLPRYWHDPRYNNPSCPVVGVTWHDAVDYCAWLTNQLVEAKVLDASRVVRLPLETEWEKAASWDAQAQRKRRYPWGDEWSHQHANTLDGRGDWLTVPVGCYPSGASAYGVDDCIGNVWEWTASLYASYPGSLTPFHDQGSYTLRGSSCASRPTHARSTYRSRLPTNYWRYHLGFRIVIGQALDPTEECTSGSSTSKAS